VSEVQCEGNVTANYDVSLRYWVKVILLGTVMCV